MSLWLSGGSRTVTRVEEEPDGSGGTGGELVSQDISNRVEDVVIETVVDDDGQFQVDLTQVVDFTVQEVLSVQVFIVDQVITPATSLANLLLAQVIEVTAAVIRGVVVAVTPIIALGEEILGRAGFGETVRVLMTLRR